MLEEQSQLSNLDGIAGRERLLALLQLIGSRFVKIEDLIILWNDITEYDGARLDVTLLFLESIGVIRSYPDSATICLSPSFDLKKGNHDIVRQIIANAIEFMFDKDILSTRHFTYDHNQNALIFSNSLLPLKWSSWRDFLVDFGCLIADKRPNEVRFYVSNEHEGVIGERIKTKRSQVSFEQLKERIKKQEELGYMAEEYALLYEKNRLGSLGMFSEIKQVSTYDVAAGYDIASYENVDSKRYDRFIEVKAVDSKMGFHWSKNEISVAEREGEHYFLYLVDLRCCHQRGYEPYIICNPYGVLQSEDEWMIEPESFYIHKMID